MIILRRKPFIDDLSLCDTIAIDTKANMLEHCRLINLDIPKSWCKAEIVDAMADFFKTAPLITVSHLPEAEKAILNRLLKLSSDAYVTHPRNDSQYLLLQDLHLVITYETPTEWHLFMPDCIREILQNLAVLSAWWIGGGLWIHYKNINCHKLSTNYLEFKTLFKKLMQLTHWKIVGVLYWCLLLIIIW